MIKNLKLILITLILLSSCSGLNNKRSQQADEFLIEKKNPLVMPPDINDLPEPKQDFIEETENEFKEKIISNSQTTPREKRKQKISRAWFKRKIIIL